MKYIIIGFIMWFIGFVMGTLAEARARYLDFKEKGK